MTQVSTMVQMKDTKEQLSLIQCKIFISIHPYPSWITRLYIRPLWSVKTFHTIVSWLIQNTIISLESSIWISVMIFISPGLKLLWDNGFVDMCSRQTVKKVWSRKPCKNYLMRENAQESKWLGKRMDHWQDFTTKLLVNWLKKMEAKFW